MARVPRRFATVLGSAAILGALLAAPASASAKSASTTCWGGPIAPGSYANLVVAGDCFTPGPIVVNGNVTVSSGARLITAFGGANVTVTGNLSVGSNALLMLGCEPFAFLCINDPEFPFGAGTLSASFSIGGSLVADGALTVLVHNGSIGRNLALSGGGGGLDCRTPVVFGFLPAYATFEDVSVSGNASISGWTSCWLGFIRDTVGGNLNFSDNATLDPDGNEVATNTIGHNLNCAGNSPAPQIGDSGGALNSVARKATGQCTGLTN